MGALIIYGVSEKAIAYRIQIPPDYTGSPLTLATDQLAMASKVSRLWGRIVMRTNIGKGRIWRLGVAPPRSGLHQDKLPLLLPPYLCRQDQDGR